MKPSISILLYVIAYLSSSLANKYTKEANAPSAVDDFPSDPNEPKLRVQKLNFIWSKATRQLTSPEQKELFLYLKKLDKQFLAAKYERNVGGDSEGILEKDLERALENLLNRFGLSSVYESLASDFGEKKFDGSAKGSRNEARGSDSAKSKSATFKDQKLRRLWLDAMAAGDFDDEELSALEEEFQHHQGKLDEYGKMSANAAKKLSPEEKENSVLHEDSDDDDDDKTNVNAELKQRFKDIQRNYDSLKTKVGDKVQSKKMDSVEAITHPRVVPLLEKARAMYSGVELESIEEELRHFQARLKKLEYLEREASQGKVEMDAATKAKKEKSAKIYDREVGEQFSDLSRKVDKYERYLSSKLEL